MKKITMLLLPLLFSMFIFINPAEAGDVDNALNFNGTVIDQRVQTSEPIPYTISYTVMAWVKTDLQVKVLTWAEAGIGNSVDIEVYNGNFRCRATKEKAVPNTVTSTIPIGDGTWHHVAATKNAGTISVYVDGVFEASLAGFADNIIPIYSTMGAGYINNHWQGNKSGTLDELSVWSTALTESEIAAYMASGLVGTEANLIAYYNFDNPAVTPGGDNTTVTGNVILVNNAVPPGKAPEDYDGTLTLFSLNGATGNWVEGYAPPPTPLSDWAIYMGVFLIATFILLRYRRRVA